MKVYRNIKEIKKKETMGRRFSLAGMAVLFVGLLVSFVPTWYPPTAPLQPGIVGFAQQYWSWLSFGALFAGFFCASIGSYYINRYARRRWPGSRFVERPDEVFERSLKGFDDKFTFFSQSLPAAYVVAGPNGVTVFTVRSDKGKVQVNGEKWREPFTFSRLFTFFAREGVGNPDKDIADQSARLRELLTKANGTTAAGDKANLAEVPIDGATVFLNAEIQLELNNPTVTVLRADQVKDYLRARAKDVKVPNATQRALTDALVQSAVYQEEISE